MQHSDAEEALTRRLVEWAEGQETVRAVLLTGSRASAGAPIDALSDYDVILYLSDPNTLQRDDGWLRDFGPVLVKLRDPVQRTRLVLYRDGTKIDFTLAPVGSLRAAAAAGLPEGLDAGYRVLLDKDGLTTGLGAPSGAAYVPHPPTREEFLALVEEFWWETTYVAKNLRRGELLPARYSLECVLKLDLLRRMLEWHVETEHAWSLRPGVLGRRLRQHLAPELWAALEATFVGADIEENWWALFATIELFRRVAAEVATRLDLEYAERLDESVTRYLNHVRSLEP